MRESSLVPTTLLDWPRVGELDLAQKLILIWLWASRYTNSIGVATVPPCPAAASLGLDEEVLVEAMKKLSALGRIRIDSKAGEIFICDWFRFHRFVSAEQRGAASHDLRKVRSARIKRMVVAAASNVGVALASKSEKHPLRSSTATRTGTGTGHLSAVRAEQAPGARKQPTPSVGGAAAKKRLALIGGIQCWDAKDVELATELVKQWGGEAVARAVADLQRAGSQPLPSRVAKILAEMEGNNGPTFQNNQPFDILELGRLGRDYLYPNGADDADPDFRSESGSD